jgi:hypothetical protein
VTENLATHRSQSLHNDAKRRTETKKPLDKDRTCGFKVHIALCISNGFYIEVGTGTAIHMHHKNMNPSDMGRSTKLLSPETQTTLMAHYGISAAHARDLLVHNPNVNVPYHQLRYTIRKGTNLHLSHYIPNNSNAASLLDYFQSRSDISYCILGSSSLTRN